MSRYVYIHKIKKYCLHIMVSQSRVFTHCLFELYTGLLTYTTTYILKIK